MALRSVELRNLLAATEAVGDDQRHGAGGLNRRQQPVAAQSPSTPRTCPPRSQMARPCRSSRPGSARPSLRPGGEDAISLCRPAENGLMVAVAVEQNLCALETVARAIGCFGHQASPQAAISARLSALRARRLEKVRSNSSLKTLAQLGSRKMKGSPASIWGAMRSRTFER